MSESQLADALKTALRAAAANQRTRPLSPGDSARAAVASLLSDDRVRDVFSVDADHTSNLASESVRQFMAQRLLLEVASVDQAVLSAGLPMASRAGVDPEPPTSSSTSTTTTAEATPTLQPPLLQTLPSDLLAHVYGRLDPDERSVLSSLSSTLRSMIETYKTEITWNGTFRRYPRVLAWKDGPRLHDEVWAFWEACTLKHACWTGWTMDSLLRYKLGLFALDWTPHAADAFGINYPSLNLNKPVAALDGVHHFASECLLDFLVYAAFQEPEVLVLTRDKYNSSMRAVLSAEELDAQAAIDSVFTGTTDRKPVTPQDTVQSHLQFVDLYSRVHGLLKMHLQRIADLALEQLTRVQQEMDDLRATWSAQAADQSNDTVFVPNTISRFVDLKKRHSELCSIYILACQWWRRVIMLNTTLPWFQQDYDHCLRAVPADTSAASPFSWQFIQSRRSRADLARVQWTAACQEARVLTWCAVASVRVFEMFSSHVGIRNHYVVPKDMVPEAMRTRVGHFYPLDTNTTAHTIFSASVFRIFHAYRPLPANLNWADKADQYELHRGELHRWLTCIKVHQNNLREVMVVANSAFALCHYKIAPVAFQALQHATAVRAKVRQETEELEELALRGERPPPPTVQKTIYSLFGVVRDDMLTSSIPECVYVYSTTELRAKFDELGVPVYSPAHVASRDVYDRMTSEAANTAAFPFHNEVLLEPCAILKWWVPDYAELGLWHTDIRNVTDQTLLACAQAYRQYTGGLANTCYDSTVSIDQRCLSVRYATDTPANLPTDRRTRVIWLYANLWNYQANTCYLSIPAWEPNMGTNTISIIENSYYLYDYDRLRIFPVTFLQRQLLYPTGSAELRQYALNEADPTQHNLPTEQLRRLMCSAAHFVPGDTWDNQDGWWQTPFEVSAICQVARSMLSATDSLLDYMFD